MRKRHSEISRNPRGTPQNTVHLFRVFRIAGIACAVVAAGAFLFFSRFFTIEFVDVQAQGGFDQSAVRAVVFAQMDHSRFWLFGQKNILLFSGAELKTELARRFVVDAVNVTKRLPHTIRVSLTGKPFRLLYVGEGKVFDLASDGSVSADFSDSAGDGQPAILYARALAHDPTTPAVLKKSDIIDAPIVRAEPNTNSVGTSAYLDPSVVLFIRDVFARSRTSGYQPLFFSLSGETPLVRMKTREGWDVLFSKIEPAERQVDAVGVIVQKLRAEERTRLEYIDVRFGNRAFYK